MKDVQEAVEEALALTQEHDIHGPSVRCLLRILEERYSSKEEVLTDADVRDVIEQRRLLKGFARTAENYDYFEYDQDSLDDAITNYYLNERLTFGPTDSPNCYKVLRHRMPGVGASDVDFQRLLSLVRSWLPVEG